MKVKVQYHDAKHRVVRRDGFSAFIHTGEASLTSDWILRMWGARPISAVSFTVTVLQ